MQAPYTVVISDVRNHDTGMRGTDLYWRLAARYGAYAELGLYWFLCEHFGRSAVRLTRPSRLLRESSPLATDWLFVGLPTTLNKQHLSRIKCRRMVLYDSTDYDRIEFGDSDQHFLASNTNIFLKNWRDRKWDFDFTMGLLPIKRPPLNNKLSHAVRLRAAKERLGFRAKKKYDVGFVARPTGTLSENPRVKWLVDLKRERPQLSIWGGLVGKEKGSRNGQGPSAELLESCWLNRRKIRFGAYFSGLCQSKVALAPRGFAPWSYRHFEAIYARSIVVSSDLSQFEFLIPFPRDGMVEVPEGESVVPAVDRAIALYDERPDIVQSNLDYLNRWLVNGRYSRKRTEVLERFFAQLETV